MAGWLWLKPVKKTCNKRTFVTDDRFCWLCSNFDDIFDVEHFISVLAPDVRIIKELPMDVQVSTPVHRMSIPRKSPPQYYEKKVLQRLLNKQVGTILGALDCARLYEVSFVNCRLPLVRIVLISIRRFVPTVVSVSSARRSTPNERLVYLPLRLVLVPCVGLEIGKVRLQAFEQAGRRVAETAMPCEL